MKFIPTSIPEVILIEPQVFGDERGFFFESYQAERFAAAGIPTNFVQDNHSGSRQGTLRGIHYQIKQAQGKLVRVVAGEVYDVAVDLRRSSPTFGKWVSARLSAQNKLQLWIPPGFGHGFYVLSEWAELVYKASDFYAPQWDRTIIWNDPQLCIDWPIPDGSQPILSAKDLRGVKLSEADLYD
ncbi:MAG: dTDP-4-dehydrorhamnose 3,5-epimerase [Chloroflexi bacterium]|jgi:dTDP-4-dehydrorhamnose 3,5-epimerase|nr:dTDP-4-dehydrorhamnose 3,5-epimerase [Chloroflexota bacterium]